MHKSEFWEFNIKERGAFGILVGAYARAGVAKPCETLLKTPKYGPLEYPYLFYSFS